VEGLIAKTALAEATPLEEILRVRIGEWYGIQSGKSAYSPYFGLIPQVYAISPHLKVDLSIGFIAFHVSDLEQQTLAVDLLSRLHWMPQLKGFSYGIAVGTQTWINENTGFEATAGINSPPIFLGTEEDHATVDFFVDYLAVAIPIGLTHGFRAGVTLHAP